MDKDESFATGAIEAAGKSVTEGDEPRPKVGATLAKDDLLMGTAFRGELNPGEHAEYTLLEGKLREAKTAGSTLYTTLEPCTSRNSPKEPCVEHILNRRISRVVIGMLDPDQSICGKGVQRLRDSGVQVDLFPPRLMAEVEDMNREFIAHQKAKWAKERKEIAEAAKSAERSDRYPFINVRFDDDTARLKRNFDPAALIGRETIFIVVGEGIVSELLDRHTAGILRDAIDSLDSTHPFRRGIIVTDHAWLENDSLKKYREENAAISIGSRSANRLTRDLSLATSPNKADQQFLFDRGGLGLYLAGPPRRVALWGYSARTTLAAVTGYIMRPGGLKSFLEAR